MHHQLDPWHVLLVLLTHILEVTRRHVQAVPTILRPQEQAQTMLLIVQTARLTKTQQEDSHARTALQAQAQSLDQIVPAVHLGLVQCQEVVV